MKFKFRHPVTGEEKTVIIDKNTIRLQLEEFAHESLCECQPEGETNLVECNCEEYYENFELVAGEGLNENEPVKNT